MAERFSWVLENKLSGMERPGLFQNIQKDLIFLKDRGISVIVNLEEYSWDYPSFEVLNLPVGDFQPPKPEDFENYIEFISPKIAENKKVLVHCHAGMGRTNLMIAAYIVNKEMIKPDLALERVKNARPVHWVTEDQEKSLWDYFYTLDIKEII